MSNEENRDQPQTDEAEEEIRQGFPCPKCGNSDWRDRTVTHPVVYIESICNNCGYSFG